MNDRAMIAELAKGLSENAKFDIIRSFKETALHKELFHLLQSLYPNAYVEITHGVDEFGRDLVVATKDPIGSRITGFIVKTGDIRSRASGQVDEIKSQAEQAFAHPILLKGHEFQGNQGITFLTIIIAGMLSKQALIRLNAEINKPIYRPNLLILDLKWLVDNFTQHYPYVFYEGNVSHYLEFTLKKLEEKHLFSNRDKSLSECYVEPSVATYESYVVLTDPEITLTILRDKTTLKQMEHEVQPNKKFLILGDPGIGKSTALRKMAIDMLSEGLRKATRSIEDKIGIPIFITAQDFSTIETAEQLLQRFGPPVETRDRFQIVTLLVDGLDEADKDVRAMLLDKASDFAKELQCGLIVSTRKIDIAKQEASRYEKRELLPMEYNQALNMFGKLTKDKKVLQSLAEGLKKIEQRIVITPLNLLFLVELVESNKEVPASLTELYDRFIDVALGSEDRLKKGISVLFDYQVKKRFLAQLAYDEYFKNNRLKISRKEFDEFITQYCNEFKWNCEELKTFTSEIERAGLLNIRENVEFSHKSFLDYFVASKIFDTREEIADLYNYLASIYYSENWGDVALFFAGLKKDIPKKFLDTLFQYETKQKSLIRSVEKLMIGQLIQAAWASRSNTKLYGVGKSLGYSDRIAEQFLGVARQTNASIPQIWGEIYTLKLSEAAFGSRFLANENIELIERYLKKPNGRSILKCERLLWAIRDKVDDKIVSPLIGRLLAVTQNCKDITDAEAAKSFLILRIMAANDKKILASINKGLRKAVKSNPSLFAKIAPVKKPGSITPDERRRARLRKRKSRL